MKRFFALPGLVAGVLALSVGFASVPAAASAPTIVGIASTTPGFETLTAAVVCTGLAPTLNGTRNYTVFAPTNAAFAKLGLNAGNVCSAVPKATLKQILLYHVVNGARYARNILPRGGRVRTVETVLGQSFKVNSSGTIFTTSGGQSQIVTPNITASNGVIHVVNSVLVPNLAAGNDEDNDD